MQKLNNTRFSLLNSHFLAMKYWPTWVLLGLLRAIAALPFSCQKRLAYLLTPLVLFFAKSRVHVCRVNLKKAFPEWSEAELEKKVRACFFSFVLGAIESNATYWVGRDRFLKICPFSVEGMEHLEAAMASGKGVIVCGYHLHLVDMACRSIGEKLRSDYGVKTAVVYQANKNPLVDKFLYGWRHRYAEKVFRRKELKNMLSWLKQKNILLYAPDQDFGHAPSVFAPFFNIPTATITASSRLVQHTGSVLISGIYVRKNGQYFMKFLPPIQNYPSGDDLWDATQLNAIYESVIREYPEQYLWQHRRFKTRPMGEASFYE